MDPQYNEGLFSCLPRDVIRELVKFKRLKMKLDRTLPVELSWLPENANVRLGMIMFRDRIRMVNYEFERRMRHVYNMINLLYTVRTKK
jgi:hypothetical protein